MSKALKSDEKWTSVLEENFIWNLFNLQIYYKDLLKKNKHICY